ncbi:phosphoribosylformylglycinamidine synthase I [Candidatus Curtissbacteria bacterium RBG_13_35_7]|uniref:Phosphoribosylformylglycinamidine synthase I n=1 Tax=Candidatus Curtissbacteria bacterium RBG_13_35_7 TaxID=1797705 RepID=A0A1F5G1I4_9BACT|nr:MAG: phosphoribosylformylglycinamidine synthase I [Candidatus Curtissbacteria bacterium RBG_13_35_7]
MKPTVCILRTDGTNCDEELFYALEKYGAKCQNVHVNELRSNSQKLANFQILALPGGFSYGDDIASGKVLAIELISFLADQLNNFVNKKGLILGVCNGFQTLIRTGLLPFNNFGKMDATLAQNMSGHFECRWIKIRLENSPCVFLKSTNQILEIPVNHGEGKFYAPIDTLGKIEKQNLVVFRYVDEKGIPTQKYPQNPNDSQNAIAGICDPTGRILGLMPHLEKFVDITQHPNWRRFNIKQSHGSLIFKGMVNYFK